MAGAEYSAVFLEYRCAQEQETFHGEDRMSHTPQRLELYVGRIGVCNMYLADFSLICLIVRSGHLVLKFKDQSLKPVWTYS